MDIELPDQEVPEEELSFLQMLPLLYRLLLSSIPENGTHLTRTQIVILNALTLKPELTMTEISVYIASSKEQATRAVAPLVEQGLLERFISDENRTRVHVCLTEQGRVYINGFLAQCRESLNKYILTKLSEKEKKELARSIKTTTHLLSKAFD